MMNVAKDPSREDTNHESKEIEYYDEEEGGRDNNNCCNTNTTPTTTTRECINTQCIPLGEDSNSNQCVNVCFQDSPAPIPSNTPASSKMQRIRVLLAEAMGTGALALIVVGSGIMAENLTTDVGLQLLANALATTCGLYGLITTLGPISGAHLNPVVSMVDCLYHDMSLTNLVWFTLSQISGGIVGTILANLQFAISPILRISTKERFGYELWISEVLATASLVFVIHGCIRTGQKQSVPYVVSAWVGGGYFFTSSSIFANPAMTIARVFTDTFAGIDPKSMAAYIGFQMVGGVLGFLLTRFFYPKHLQPLQQDDTLYRRVCVLNMKDFYEKEKYG